MDLPTAFLLIAVTSLTLGVAIRLAQSAGLENGLRHLSHGLMAHGVGYTLLCLAPADEPAALVAAQMGVALFFSFALRALAAFHGVRSPAWLHVFLLGGMAGLTLAFLDDRAARIVTTSVIMIVVELVALRLVWSRRRVTPGRGQYLIVGAIGLSLATFVYREVTALSALGATGLLSVSSASQTVLFVPVLVGLTLLAVGFILMVGERTEEQNRQMIQTDGLTGVWNRRKIEAAGDGELQRLVRYGTPVTQLLLDLDDFKAINDTRGHATGDAVLKAVTEAWRQVLRETDMLGRWGGEEFLVLLPGSGIGDAVVLAERLRAAVGTIDLDLARPITVSIGLAMGLSHDTWARWFERADAALYRAKAAGKNRIVYDIPLEVEAGTSLIRWSAGLETGLVALDEDHRALVEHSNRLLRTLRESGDKTAVLADLAVVELEMLAHFGREEVMIAEMHPGMLAEHRAEHLAIARRLNFLRERFETGALPLDALVQFLVFEMCAHHIAGSDIDLFRAVDGAADLAAA